MGAETAERSGNDCEMREGGKSVNEAKKSVRSLFIAGIRVDHQGSNLGQDERKDRREWNRLVA